MSAPRYRQLTEVLRKDIETGRYPIGSLLPPEVELCAAYGVSRHTIRDAIRLLREAGLVERRRGLGTTVLAAAPPVSFIQPLGSVTALLQYARDARLAVRKVERRALDPLEAQALRIAQDDRAGPWLAIDGHRSLDGKTLAISRILLAPRFAGLEREAADWGRAFQELIAEQYGVHTDRVEQEISAQLLDQTEAKAFGVRTGDPALRTLRRYYDAAGGLILASDSLHPADRFVYAMSYRRDS